MSPAAKTQCHNIFCNPPDAPHFRLVIFVCRWYFRNVIPTARITFFASGSAHYVTTGTYTGMQPTSRKVHLALILCHCSGLGFCWWLSGMALAGQGHCRWHMSLCRPPLLISSNCPAACYSPHTSGYMTRLMESVLGTDIVPLCRTQLLPATVRCAIHRIRWAAGQLPAGYCGSVLFLFRQVLLGGSAGPLWPHITTTV